MNEGLAAMQYGAGGAHPDARQLDDAVRRERVRVRDQRKNGDIDALQASCGPLKVAVIYCQHDGISGGCVEDPPEPVLHSPVKRVAAFQEKRVGLHGNTNVVVFPIL